MCTWTLTPAAFLGDTGSPLAYTLVHYSGGVVIGVAWLIAYLVWYKKFWRERTGLGNWTVGFIIAVNGTEQLGLGVMEGAFHDAYILGASNPLSIIGIYQIWTGIIALGLHAYFTDLRTAWKRWKAVGLED